MFEFICAIGEIMKNTKIILTVSFMLSFSACNQVKNNEQSLSDTKGVSNCRIAVQSTSRASKYNSTVSDLNTEVVCDEFKTGVSVK